MVPGPPWCLHCLAILESFIPCRMSESAELENNHNAGFLSELSDGKEKTNVS